MTIGARFSHSSASVEKYPVELTIYSKWYQWCIAAAAIAVLCDIAITDLRIFKIYNSRVLLLALLYCLFAATTRAPYEILSNVALSLAMFAFLFLFYLKNVVGGGDVKLLPVACLWVGTNSALPFSVFLLAFTGLHLFAARLGWAPTLMIGGKRAISYAPSVAAAVICVIVLDWL